LVDFAEATYQRNVYPLACWLQHDHTLSSEYQHVLAEAIINGLKYAAQIQHQNGSFDQAFPHEHSFGATAFLLHPLLKTYEVVQEQCPGSVQESIEECLHKAADFLCRHDETHGFISNHISGAVLSLLVAEKYFSEPRYELRAIELLNRILDNQSPEGWFLEYDGADPGYQSLGMYYLAQAYRLRPDKRLRTALEKAVDFLAWFVHPDGTFGGEYGSRRTAIFYPGGLYLLSGEFELAYSMTHFMLEAILNESTMSPANIDMGNLAPLLSNYALLLGADFTRESHVPLPWQRKDATCDYSEAGLYIRGTNHYYAILGVSNGGVLKVFDKEKNVLSWNDAGYVGQVGKRTLVTTQITDRNRFNSVNPAEIVFTSPFYQMQQSLPGPLGFIVLRILNVTAMRNIFLGNLVKGLLVDLMIRGKRRVSLVLRRTVQFEQEQVKVRDVVRLVKKMDLHWLTYGRPFVAIHMASARYFENPETAFSALDGKPLPVDTLLKDGVLEHRVTI
jgi:hypothetical protein